MGHLVPPERSYMVQGPVQVLAYAALAAAGVVGAPWVAGRWGWVE